MNTIEKITVNSSAINTAEYISESEVMTVYFNNGSVYEYSHMPKFYWRGLYESTSKGKFLNSFVFGRFPFNKVSK